MMVYPINKEIDKKLNKKRKRHTLLNAPSMGE